MKRTIIKDDAASYSKGIIYEAKITIKDGKQKEVTVIDNIHVHSQSHSQT